MKAIYCRLLYASLLSGYLLLLQNTEQGPSETGLVPYLEVAPLVVLAIQAARPTTVLWLLIALVAAVYGALIVPVLVRSATDSTPVDWYRFFVWLWVCVVLVLTRPRKRTS